MRSDLINALINVLINALINANDWFDYKSVIPKLIANLWEKQKWSPTWRLSGSSTSLHRIFVSISGHSL